MSSYPTLDAMNNGGSNLIPQPLKVCMDILIQGSQGKENDKSRTITMISQSIIAACHPKPFLFTSSSCPISTLTFKVRLKTSISLLHSISRCASYNETIAYLNAANENVQPDVSSDVFVQYVFGNADIITRTIDGHGTIHILGGIKFITPGKKC